MKEYESVTFRGIQREQTERIGDETSNGSLMRLERELRVLITCTHMHKLLLAHGYILIWGLWICDFQTR